MSYCVQVDDERCKSCELCLAACPKKIMVMTSRKNTLGFAVAECADAKQCTGCLACALICPDAAIEIFKEQE